MIGARAVRRTLVLGLVGAAASACSRAAAPAAASPLLAFAAADLREALPEIAAEYRRGGGDSIVLAFGATGDLAAQIANGAPADLFLAADESTPARLAAVRAVVDSSRRVYAIGRLALATGRGAAQVLRLADLVRPTIRTIVLADPAHAPYGRAAQEALDRAGVLAEVRAKLVYAPNVAQAFRVVQSGDADAGFVSLAAVSGAGRHPAYVRVDTTLYTPIRQAAAVVASSTRRDRAARFLAYLTDRAGTAVLRRYGFAQPSASGATAGGPATPVAAVAPR